MFVIHLGDSNEMSFFQWHWANNLTQRQWLWTTSKLINHIGCATDIERTTYIEIAAHNIACEFIDESTDILLLTSA